jgi:hypothetical protein
MSIGISCPQTNNNIAVHLQGGQQTICVCGSYSTPGPFQKLLALIKAFFRWLIGLFIPKPAGFVSMGAQTIRVRVIGGAVTTPPSPASQAGDCNISPPVTPWCCTGVQLSSGGTVFTVFAWLLNADGTIADGPHSAIFHTGGSGATIDCCASCAGAQPHSHVATELASHPPLEVAVPDGPRAGLHRATAVSHMTWELPVGGVTYRLCFGCGALPVLLSPASSAPSTSVEREPFSATFPGAVFGAAGDVVVTIA